MFFWDTVYDTRTTECSCCVPQITLTYVQLQLTLLDDQTFRRTCLAMNHFHCTVYSENALCSIAKRVLPNIQGGPKSKPEMIKISSQVYCYYKWQYFLIKYSCVYGSTVWVSSSIDPGRIWRLGLILTYQKPNRRRVPTCIKLCHTIYYKKAVL